MDDDLTTPTRPPGIHAGWARLAAPPSATRPRPAAGVVRPCRVEHQAGGTTTVLASGLLALPRHEELVPFVSWLRRAGAAGEVVLVDEASGAEWARRGVVGRTAAAPPALPAFVAD